MRILPPTLLATAILGLAAGMAQPARAVDIIKTMFIDPSSACQLSIPTIDSAVRPRATGYRNEGASNAFVICGATFYSDFAGDVTSLQFQLTAFDGASHDVSCTAVNRQSAGDGAVFSAKVNSVGSGSNSISWTPAELNSFGGIATSVTCNLPPGVAVTGIRLVINDNVGA